MSGVPGAGKSTWIKDQPWFNRSITYSADHYFLKDGVYQFDPSKLGEAHGQCLRQFIEGCQTHSTSAWGKDGILVVDNTNTTAIEIAPYYSIAKAYGYQVTLVSLWITPAEAFKRCIHGVPQNSIANMLRRMTEDSLPRHWKLKMESYQWKGDAWSQPIKEEQ